MQSRRTLTLTLSLLLRERGTFGGTVSGSPNRDPRKVGTSSPRSERGEDQGEGLFRLHTYELAARVNGSWATAGSEPPKGSHKAPPARRPSSRPSRPVISGFGARAMV